MTALTSADIVAVWKAGGQRPGWGKALALLALISSGIDSAALCIGARNAELLALRRDTIGPAMHVIVKCPACGEPLGFEQEVDELLERHAPADATDFTLTSGGIDLRYRRISPAATRLLT